MLGPPRRGTGPATRPDMTGPGRGGDVGTRGSVTRWIGDLKAGGDPDAAASASGTATSPTASGWRARGSAPRPARLDEEDVALSPFHSLCEGTAHGRFARLADRDDLWRLLATITARKAINQARHQHRRKRGGGRGHDKAALLGPDASSGGMDQLAGPGPTAEFAAMMGEECTCSMPWATKRPARSPCSGWRATAARRSPNGWDATAGR